MPIGKRNGVQNNVDSFQDIVYNNVSIAVVGNNVYYANGQAWENGAIIPLTKLGNGVVASAFADGSTIFILSVPIVLRMPCIGKTVS